MTKKITRKKRMARPLAVGTGLLALDAVTSADDSLPVRYWAGGTCGNVLIALRYLGWKAQPVARLANDTAAALLLRDLRLWGVSERFIRIEEDGTTPIIVHRIKRDADGSVKHSFSWRCSSCGARYPGYKPELAAVAEKIASKIKNPAVYFFDRLSAAALALAKAAAEHGALVVFEPSSVGNPIHFQQAWAISHIVKYSHERLSEFPEVDNEASPRLVIETLGDAGLRYRWRRHGNRLGTWVDSPAMPVEDLKDAAGSGDWCTAGLLSKVATKRFAGFSTCTHEEIDKAIKYGQALAAWNCRFEGARGGMYAVTKKVFSKQVDEILSGSRHVMLLAKSPAVHRENRGVVCRACEDSASRTRPTRRKAT